MSDSENLDYLQPGFDAKSLTIPRLRSILVSHNVPYSSSAKKAQLVDIFNEKVLPQSKKILDARARAKRSSRGIVDADSQSSSTPFDDQEELPPPRASTRRSRSPRKASARIKSEELETEPPMPAPVTSPSKRASRASSRQLRASDADTNPDTDGSVALRRVRREPTPQIKKEDSDEGFFRRTSDVFTRDNPFQSGSSPSIADDRPSSRRRTTGPLNARSPSGGTRRRTGGPVDPDKEADDGYVKPNRLGTPPNLLRRQKTPEPELSVIEPGEEFTPEEQLELAAEQALNGGTELVPSRQSYQAAKGGWGTPLLVLFITILGVYAGWYRQEKIAVGYCGVGQIGSSIPSEFEVPEWAQSVLPPRIATPQSVIDALEPNCEPCPPHAYCYADFSVRCEQDYILKPHPFALGGVIPLPPTCEPDGEKARRVQSVADRAVEELRERTAQFECGDSIDEAGTKLETAAIEEQELKQTISKKRSKKMSNDEFEDLWGSALGDIKARDEVEVDVKPASDSGSVPNTYLTSTSLSRVPITCAVRRSIRLGLARHRLKISTLMALVATLVYARYRYRSARTVMEQVPPLVNTVLERLATQRQLGDEDVDDPWLFLPNLRDDVLRSVHSLRERERIWERVKRVVEQNSNVRTGQREGRSGEIGRAWEWIGPTAADGARRRKSGRVSFGPDVKGEEEYGSSPAQPALEDKSKIHQKWEESRPIY
ncbi:Man1-Src1p-C-terminal domain-containing protein [Xylariomycetidae sp. FL2044]|nr:Man1-Src1p-C-terminal domain-containing protein [Xylariomycetidae sp. FL2044]